MGGADEDAVEVWRRKAARVRRLARKQPHAYRRVLPRTIRRLAGELWSVGRREEACALSEEVVAIRRAQTYLPYKQYRGNLAEVLSDLYGCLVDLGRDDAALTVALECAELRRPSTATPNIYEINHFAFALKRAGDRLADHGRLEESVAVTRECVDAYKDYAENQPEFGAPLVIESLATLGERLAALSRRDEAIAAADEALAYTRAHAEHIDPERLAPRLARHERLLTELSRVERALELSRATVDSYRALVSEWRCYEPALAAALGRLASHITAVEGPAPALPLARERMRLLWAQVEREPTNESATEALADALADLAACLRALDRGAEADALDRERAALRETIASTG